MLQKWEESTRQWQAQQAAISSRTGVEPSRLGMTTAASVFRQSQEIRSMIERAVPPLERGQGVYTGTEFWRAVEKRGELNLTLTQTERGNRPPLELMRRPAALAPDVSSSTWAPRYLEERKGQLADTLRDVALHQPDFDSLVVFGSSKPSAPEISVTAAEDVIPEEEEEPRLSEQRASLPFILGRGVPLEPAVELSANATTQPSADGCRAVLQAPAGQRATTVVTIRNSGGVVLYYRWEPVPRTSELATRHDRIERFYFDRQPGALLPGQKITRHVAFVSSHPGIFSEAWALVCTPAPPARPVLALTATATVEDATATQRQQIEHSLQARAVHAAMRRLVLSIVETVHPSPPPPPVLPPLLGQSFLERNRGRVKVYSPRAVERLRQLYEEIWLHINHAEDASGSTPAPVVAKGGVRGKEKDRPPTADQTDRPRPPKWDETIASIKELLYTEPDAAAQNAFAARLDENLAELNVPAPAPPLCQSRYDLTYAALCSFVDAMAVQAMRTRALYHIPELPFIVRDETDEARTDTRASNKPPAARKDSTSARRLVVAERRSGKTASGPGKSARSDGSKPAEAVDDGAPPATRRRVHDSLVQQTKSLLMAMVDSLEPLLPAAPRHSPPPRDYALLCSILGEQ